METVWLKPVYWLDSSLMQLNWGGGARRGTWGMQFHFHHCSKANNGMLFVWVCVCVCCTGVPDWILHGASFGCLTHHLTLHFLFFYVAESPCVCVLMCVFVCMFVCMCFIFNACVFFKARSNQNQQNHVTSKANTSVKWDVLCSNDAIYHSLHLSIPLSRNSSINVSAASLI